MTTIPLHSRRRRRLAATGPAGVGGVGYVPALDGIRAFAVSTVMAGHLGGTHLLYDGGLGVDIFFVLSGFLITSLIIGERTRRRSFSFARFYARRALRLLPALFATIAFVAVAATVERDQPWAHQTVHNLVWVVFYGANWLRAGGHDIGLLGQTWSLSVEEQFYLVWPAVTVALLRTSWSRQRVAAGLAGAAGAVALYRVAVLSAGWDPFSVSNRTDTHCDGLLMGAALAFWLASGRPLPGRARLGAAVLVGAPALAAFMELAHNVYLIEELGYVLAAVVTAAVIATEVAYERGPLHHLLVRSPARWVGQRSYALYLVHFPVYILVGVGGTRYRHWAIAVALSVAGAETLHRLVEAPALRLKRRFERTEAGLAVPPPA